MQASAMRTIRALYTAENRPRPLPPTARGPKQRCWVHLLRDLAKLVDVHASDSELLGWVEMVRDIYKAAKKAARRRVADSTRILLREVLAERLLAIAEPYAKMKDAPQRVLAKRIYQYLPELFTFVEHPQVASNNNAPQRAIRPAVISRKISGGTRSPKGSQTKTRLMSVFATWSPQGKEPIAACAQMIVASQSSAAGCMQ